MPFETTILDAGTEKKERVYVSHFVFKGNELAAITNVKPKASKETASEARRELDNFITFVKGMQKSDKYRDASIGEGNVRVKFSDIDVSKIKKITIAPLGAKKFGFDEELDLPYEAFERLYNEEKEKSAKIKFLDSRRTKIFVTILPLIVVWLIIGGVVYMQGRGQPIVENVVIAIIVGLIISVPLTRSTIAELRKK